MYNRYDRPKKMFAGLVRYFTSNASAEPHQDIIKRDCPETSLASRVKVQLTFNIYFSTSKSGGEIELWNWIPTDKEFINHRNKRENFAYAFCRSFFPESDCIISPKKGDLILFNSRKLHAVTPCDGRRLSVSCFIGYCGAK